MAGCRLIVLLGGFLIFFILFFAVHAIFKVSQSAATWDFNAVAACRMHKADQHQYCMDMTCNVTLSFQMSMLS